MESSTQTMQASVREEAKRFIPKIASANDIYKLFQLLKYPEDKLFDSSYKRDIDEFDFKKDERDKVKAIYTVFSYQKDLPIFLMEATTTSHTFLKYVTRVLADRYLRFLLVATSDYEQIVFVLPDYERVETGKHKLRIAKLVVDKDDLYYTDLETIVSIAFRGETSWRDLWKKWRDAFDVEKVTEQFFLDYQEIFFKVRSAVAKQRIATKDAHEFTLQLLNRIMFIYFVSKKRWLNNDPKFMRWLWNRYLLERNKGKVPKDSFYGDWLTVIFFEAFNNRFRDSAVLPDDVKKALRDAPYLNGGLFRKSDLDKLSIKISDDLFKEVFQFFERYNFTIREDLLDAEVAVDPQMIGYVYESLANVAESSYEREEDLRKAWGIFYTPRVEVEFMCKRALVEYLANHMSQVPKEKLYEFVFDDDKEKAEAFFEKQRLWYDLEELLDNISVVDPACGSGAFLVGMVNVLSELYRVIYRHMKRDLTDFELKNKIIMRSLYGVDVMPWAVHAAELRLWLQLIVESDLRPDDLKAHPLLPNLNMNLRIGDSLVQEVGGINLHVRDPAISPKLKQRLLELKTEKEKYFNNDPTAKFKSKDDLEEEEIRIFNEVMEERLTALSEERTRLSRQLSELERGTQKDLRGNVLRTPPEKIKPVKERLELLVREVDNLETVQRSLRDPEKRLFVWEIGFAETFGQKGGFDIVIGNPPYVRYQKILPPTKMRQELDQDDIVRYKEQLIRSVHSHFADVVNIDMKSDYYLYFYFDGLALLNRSGTLCLITSNSWLDVQYGRALREFLLRRSRILAIYDNPKRSFAHADINTVICVLSAPVTRSGISLIMNAEEGVNAVTASEEQVARFVMFKKPFEEVTMAKNLIEIEESDGLISTADFRVEAVQQSVLLEEGLDHSERGSRRQARGSSSSSYVGSMWGAKYLRSPDIFLRILDRYKSRLITLGEIAVPETYLNTLGADDFFFVSLAHTKAGTSVIRSRIDGSEHEIEDVFLTDLIESPKELSSIVISGSFPTKLFRIPMGYKDLTKAKAYEYVKFGKRRGFNTQLPRAAYDGGTILLACYMGDTHLFYYNPQGVISHRFFRIKVKQPGVPPEKLVLVLNSTFTSLSLEILKNPSLGAGVLAHGTYTLREFVIPTPQAVRLNPDRFGSFLRRPIKSVFEECGIDPEKSIREQQPNPPPDRRQLDDMVFEAVGLTEDERKEVYWSVCELVKARLDKAKSLKKRG